MLWTQILRSLLYACVFSLVSTIICLCTVSWSLSIDREAYISGEKNGPEWNTPERTEIVPRILHRVSLTDTIPSQWLDNVQHCQNIMPNYEQIVWSDTKSREFIAKEYPWFLQTYDTYPYPSQRADAIRYFVLYHYGGVYLDVDIGCRRPVDNLLVYPVVLPKALQAGVSNDFIIAQKKDAFLEHVIYNLATFDHHWLFGYMTQPLSTGSMFLSIQYKLWASSHKPKQDTPRGDVWILPRSSYGRNRIGEATEAYLSLSPNSYGYAIDYYAGSSRLWLGFIDKEYVVFAILILLCLRLLWWRQSKRLVRESRALYYRSVNFWR